MHISVPLTQIYCTNLWTDGMHSFDKSISLYSRYANGIGFQDEGAIALNHSGTL